MAGTLELTVLTEGGVALKEPVVSIRAPGAAGYLGILHNHAPLVTTLSPGTLSWRQASGERWSARLGPGLLEVVRNQVTILTERMSETAAAER